MKQCLERQEETTYLAVIGLASEGSEDDCQSVLKDAEEAGLLTDEMTARIIAMLDFRKRADRYAVGKTLREKELYIYNCLLDYCKNVDVENKETMQLLIATMINYTLLGRITGEQHHYLCTLLARRSV